MTKIANSDCDFVCRRMGYPLMAIRFFSPIRYFLFAIGCVLAMPMMASGQSTKQDTTSFSYPVQQGTLKIIKVESNPSLFQFRMMLLDGSGIEYGGSDPPSLIISGDTVKSVLVLMRHYQQVVKLNAAAEEVLANIRINGKISNWKAFTRAAKRYMALKMEIDKE